MYFKKTENASEGKDRLVLLISTIIGYFAVFT